jgi:hypothetical protein
MTDLRNIPCDIGIGMAYIRGHTDEHDGGEGLFSYNPFSVEADDDGIEVHPNGTFSGSWHREINFGLGEINAAIYGRVTNSTLERAMVYMTNHNIGVLRIPGGIHYINADGYGLTVLDNITLAGDNGSALALATQPSTNYSMLTIAGTNIVIANLNLVGWTATPPGDIGTVYYWPMTEVSGTRSSTATDLDLDVVTGAPSRTTGIIDYAASFTSAAPDGLQSTDTTIDSFATNSLSMTAWVKLSTKPGWGDIVIHGTDHAVADFDFGLVYNGTGDRFSFLLSSGTATNMVSSDVLGSPVTGTWYFLTATFDGSNMVMYVNGVLQGTTTATAIPAESTFPYSVGSGSAGVYPVNGLISDVAVYNQVLTANQALGLYAAGVGLRYPFFDNTGRGITVSGANKVTLSHVAVRSQWTDGIHIADSTNVTVEGAVLANCLNLGITVNDVGSGSENVTLTDNRAEDSTTVWDLTTNPRGLKISDNGPVTVFPSVIVDGGADGDTAGVLLQYVSAKGSDLDLILQIAEGNDSNIGYLNIGGEGIGGLGDDHVSITRLASDAWIATSRTSYDPSSRVSGPQGMLHITSQPQTDGASAWLKVNGLNTSTGWKRLLTTDDGATPGGVDTSVQYKDGLVFGGDADFTWNKTTHALSLTSAIALGLPTNMNQWGWAPSRESMISIHDESRGENAENDWWIMSTANAATFSRWSAFQFQTRSDGTPETFLYMVAQTNNSPGTAREWEMLSSPDVDRSWIRFRDKANRGANNVLFLNPNAGAANTPYRLDTSILHTSGNLFEVANSNSLLAYVTYAGGLGLVDGSSHSATLTPSSSALSFNHSEAAASYQFNVASTLHYQMGTTAFSPMQGTEYLGDTGHSWVNAFLGTIYLNYAANVYITSGTGSPEGVITAGVGSMFIRRDGGASTVVYHKETGVSNTGWVAYTRAVPGGSSTELQYRNGGSFGGIANINYNSSSNGIIFSVATGIDGPSLLFTNSQYGITEKIYMNGSGYMAFDDLSGIGGWSFLSGGSRYLTVDAGGIQPVTDNTLSLGGGSTTGWTTVGSRIYTTPNVTGSNQAGVDLLLRGGKGTGTGKGGALNFATFLSGASSSTGHQTNQVRFFAPAKAVALTESTATSFFQINCDTNKSVGGLLTCTVTASDGTDTQTLSTLLLFDASNKAGTITLTFTPVCTNAVAETALGSTLTATFTAAPSNLSAILKCNAVSSLTQTILEVRWVGSGINGNGSSAVTTF